MGLPRVRISSQNPHLLSTEGGDPFFLLGDTAWRLFEVLTLEEIEFYCANRAAKGFNAFTAVVLSEFDEVTAPLLDADPRRPNEAYFQRIDATFDIAERHGLYILFLPTWGDKLTAPWGMGPRIFRNDNLEDAEIYARFLAKRYGNRTNLIWVIGGDRPPQVGDVEGFRRTAVDSGFPPDQDWTPIWCTMANAILDETGGNALLTYHPQGGPHSTSVFLHDEPWLHVNMMQSGHGGGKDVPVWQMIARDYAMSPPKPTLDGEPNYEDHPVSPWPVWDPANGYFRDDDVRRQTYRSVLGGGCGVIYGHHSIWQMWDGVREMINHADRTWREALDRPGAHQVGHLRRLLETSDWFERRPEICMIISDPGAGRERMAASRTDSTACVYFPTGRSARLAVKHFTHATWFDPRTASRSDRTPIVGDTFTPPTDDDWVLLLDRNDR